MMKTKNKTKQNKTKQNKTKQNKPKNKTKQKQKQENNNNDNKKTWPLLFKKSKLVTKHAYTWLENKNK